MLDFDINLFEREEMFSDHFSFDCYGCKIVKEKPTVCSLCTTSIIPVLLYKSILESEAERRIDGTYLPANAFFYCPKCKNVFVAEYEVHYFNKNKQGLFPVEIVFRGLKPHNHREKIFSPTICKVSALFPVIYNQSLHAEDIGLSELAGPGYRKSLEFLVKDYALYKFPQDSKNICSEFLAKTISRISDHRIQALAKNSAWIGNDLTHYELRNELWDLNRMKSFIQSTVYFIESDIYSDEAIKSINSK